MNRVTDDRRVMKDSRYPFYSLIAIDLLSFNLLLCL